METISLKTVLVFPLFVSLIFFSGCAREEQTEKTIMPRESNKKVAMLIAFTDFKDEEYFVPKEVLEKAGLEVVTVSNSKRTAQGVSGGQAPIDISLDELKVADYDGIVFIGGPGALKNLDNQTSYQIAQEAVEQNKILGAICISPVILAKAGVLQGKKATVWSSPLDKSPVKTLQENGANYQEEDIVVDGEVITGNGPAAAEKFGQAIVQRLTSSSE
ncbi:MAG: DJ-1 family protein [Candidatus Portnoybacteria bacterium CG03_land_8_20_14_0_80_41_10]|uniref:DJ-1 family protein n=1 Tax=Candidatus Portnoybacteria bacterium CG03_land_8_20_14_0_80_41_10 TaxID=1974808 RepID=A0A2M7BUH3_9BACT|nr:MAG: DJ-1 family protein [Candidatus Portnoybacteria bacterium CG03_land_8_20_14_0_80_41_10]